MLALTIFLVPGTHVQQGCELLKRAFQFHTRFTIVPLQNGPASLSRLARLHHRFYSFEFWQSLVVYNRRIYETFTGTYHFFRTSSILSAKLLTVTFLLPIHVISHHSAFVMFRRCRFQLLFNQHQPSDGSIPKSSRLQLLMIFRSSLFPREPI